MAVTYDNVAFGRIEETLKQYVDNEFQNVYISQTIRIDITHIYF